MFGNVLLAEDDSDNSDCDGVADAKTAIGVAAVDTRGFLCSSEIVSVIYREQINIYCHIYHRE